MNCFHDYLNDTPIITAINCCRNLELIKYLVRNGAEFLLDNGADINNRDSHGQTSLIKYSKAGNYNAIRLLIKYKADINIKDNDVHDALYYAELYKRKMTIELLVKYKG